MPEAKTNVLTTGKILPGFNEPEVIQAFASLFKIEVSHAERIALKKGVFKKALPTDKAKQYKNSLESIGLEVILQSAPATSQTKSAEPSITSQQNVQSTSPSNHSTDTHIPTQGSSQEIAQLFSPPNLKALGVGAATALAGMLLWYLITWALGVELSIVAWGIGGAIGYAMARFGTLNNTMALACGALAFIAIIGGKALTLSALHSQFTDIFQHEDIEQFKQMAYEEEKALAAIFMNEVFNDQEQKAFMVEHGYSQAIEVGGVTEAEIAEFETNTLPNFLAFDNNNLPFEQWVNTTEEYEQHISTWDVIKTHIGWLDFVFLFLGVGTAYLLYKKLRRFR